MNQNDHQNETHFSLIGKHVAHDPWHYPYAQYAYTIAAFPAFTSSGTTSCCIVMSAVPHSRILQAKVFSINTCRLCIFRS